MTRLHSSLFCALSMVALATGCASSEKVDDDSNENVCDEDKLGEDCTCSGKREGVYECNTDDELECVCADEDEDEDPAPSDDDEDEDPAPSDDDEDDEPPTTGKRDAGSSGSKPDAGSSSGGNDAKAPSVPDDDDDDDDGTGSGDEEPPPATGGGEPTLPEIKGTCPEFKNNTTIMAAGHRSIEIKVGPAGMKGPLVFYWHGTGSRASEVNGGLLGGFAGNQEVVSMGGIVASFNGSGSAKMGGDCSGTRAHAQSDFEAADQIVACAVKNHGIDPRRIYSTGCSAGGLQTGCMAQKRSSYMAAVAPNSGGVVFPQQWQDKNTPAIFSMHGGPQDMVIVTFSQTSEALNKAAKSHGGFVVNCNHGGGHCRTSPELSRAAWQFMKDHRFGMESPWKSGIPSGVPSYCKIY